MAGEIRAALARFRDASERMTANIVAEMDKATAICPEIEKEGITAAQMPAAVLAATRAEIREVTSEFATQTNAGPMGPLPGEVSNSTMPSVNFAAPVAQAAEKKI